jgi:hypothetical protein
MPTQEKLIIYYRGRGVEAVGQGICGNQVKLPRSFQYRRLTVAPAHINMITCSNQGSCRHLTIRANGSAP